MSCIFCGFQYRPNHCRKMLAIVKKVKLLSLIEGRDCASSALEYGLQKSTVRQYIKIDYGEILTIVTVHLLKL